MTTVTGQTPWRQLGDLAMDQFTALIPDGSPMLPESRAIYAAVKGYSALYAAQAGRSEVALRAVQKSVFASRHYLQVVRRIVRAIAIDVVHDFAAFERPSDLLLGNKPMLRDIPSNVRIGMLGPVDVDIPMSPVSIAVFRRRVSSTLAAPCRSFALRRAVPLGGRSIWLDAERLPAMSAGQRHSAAASPFPPARLIAAGIRAVLRSIGLVRPHTKDGATDQTGFQDRGRMTMHRLVLSTGAALRGCVSTRRSSLLPHIISQIPDEYAPFVKGVAV